MSKKKNKKKNLADTVQSKKVSARKKTLNMNPFEVHINKEKIRILGKKDRIERGLPGQSKAKAIEKRKVTLLQEYKLQHKSNKFNDKRIGEKDFTMTEEDRNISRFTAVRAKSHLKRKIFNLADDEPLTHRGQTLSDIEHFDDPNSDESFDENESGHLNSDFVGVAHFGGGLLKKNEGTLSHKDLIEQLITESKKHKLEQQKIRESTLELTEKLDTEWKDLIPLVSQKKKEEVLEVDKKLDLDDYDKLIRELKFAARGSVSDRLKTVDEIAKEEKEKLDELEKQRLLRMKANFEEVTDVPVHRSADDIDDNFVYEDINDEVPSDMTNNEVEADVESSEAEEGENSNTEDSLSDFKSNSTDNESDVNEIEDEPQIDFVNPEDSETMLVKNINVEENNDLLNKMEEGIEELPFTFSLPESYETLQTLLEKHSSIQQGIIIKRMVKYNHQSLAEGNKDKLGLLFAYLLQYLNDNFSVCTDNQSALQNSFQIFQALVPTIYELAEINPKNAHHSLCEVIKEKHGDYRKHPKKFPGLEVLMFFKLISILFPTSDFRHQVVSPCFLFMEQILRNCKICSHRDISYGLFIVALVLEFTSISKRFLPASINFLSGVLHQAIPKTGVKLIKVLPPFKATSSLLLLVENLSSYSQDDLKMDCSTLISRNLDEMNKIKMLYASLNILEGFHNLLKDLPSSVEIFGSTLSYLKSIDMGYYPDIVKNTHSRIVKKLEDSKDELKLPFIVMRAMKPKALRMLEPKIVEVFEGKRRKITSRENDRKQKLIQQLKKEKKGALREIRKDKDFLARVKLQQQSKSDKARQEKVKRIYAEAASQQSELKALDRRKKSKK